MIKSASVSAILSCILLASTAIAETRGFVVSGFNTAVYANEGNCTTEQSDAALRERRLIRIGYTREEARSVILQGSLVDPKERQAIREKLQKRAVVDGKPANTYSYPEHALDPNVEMVKGNVALGFNLDGEIGPNDFVDAETNERGVDNELWRALGCMVEFKVRRPDSPGPLWESVSWETVVDTMPAWTLSVSGEDLSQDGPVTVTFDRANRHMIRDALGNVLAGDTYVISPNSRSHNALQGQITNGVLTIDPAPLYLEGEHPFHYEIDLTQAQIRLQFDDQGELSGYLGGYFPWQLYTYHYTSTSINMADLLGIYWNLKKLADADPDPETGENRRISMAWHVEAVPANLVTVNGVVIARSIESSPNAEVLVAGGAN